MMQVPKANTKNRIKKIFRAKIFKKMNRQDGISVGSDLRICMRHFHPDDIDPSTHKVKKGALPIYFADWLKIKQAKEENHDATWEELLRKFCVPTIKESVAKSTNKASEEVDELSNLQQKIKLMEREIEELKLSLQKKKKEIRFDTTDNETVKDLCNFPKDVIEELAKGIRLNNVIKEAMNLRLSKGSDGLFGPDACIGHEDQLLKYIDVKKDTKPIGRPSNTSLEDEILMSLTYLYQVC